MCDVWAIGRASEVSGFIIMLFMHFDLCAGLSIHYFISHYILRIGNVREPQYVHTRQWHSLPAHRATGSPATQLTIQL